MKYETIERYRAKAIQLLQKGTLKKKNITTELVLWDDEDWQLEVFSVKMDSTKEEGIRYCIRVTKQKSEGKKIKVIFETAKLEGECWCTSTILRTKRLQ